MQAKFRPICSKYEYSSNIIMFYAHLSYRGIHGTYFVPIKHTRQARAKTTAKKMKRHRSPSYSRSRSRSLSPLYSLSRSRSPSSQSPTRKRFRSPSPDPYKKHKFYFIRALTLCIGIYYIYAVLYDY